MIVKPLRRFVYRQLILPQEYQEKLQRVKVIIQNYARHKPSSEETLMCMIDEFLNLHDGSDQPVGDQTSNADEARVQPEQATTNAEGN